MGGRDGSIWAITCYPGSHYHIIRKPELETELKTSGISPLYKVSALVCIYFYRKSVFIAFRKKVINWILISFIDRLLFLLSSLKLCTHGAKYVNKTFRFLILIFALGWSWPYWSNGCHGSFGMYCLLLLFIWFKDFFERTFKLKNEKTWEHRLANEKNLGNLLIDNHKRHNRVWKERDPFCVSLFSYFFFCCIRDLYYWAFNLLRLG